MQGSRFEPLFSPASSAALRDSLLGPLASGQDATFQRAPLRGPRERLPWPCAPQESVAAGSLCPSSGEEGHNHMSFRFDVHTLIAYVFLIIHSHYHQTSRDMAAGGVGFDIRWPSLSVVYLQHVEPYNQVQHVRPNAKSARGKARETLTRRCDA